MYVYILYILCILYVAIPLFMLITDLCSELRDAPAWWEMPGNCSKRRKAPSCSGCPGVNLPAPSKRGWFHGKILGKSWEKHENPRKIMKILRKS